MDGAGGEGTAAASVDVAQSSSLWVPLLAFGLPILVPVLGLLYCYWAASKEGLAEALKNLKKKRDRNHKRRGTKAGSAYKAKFKLSQDGKGGRSANS